MKRSGFAPRSKPMARGSSTLTTKKQLQRTSTLKAAPKRIKSRGMKGRSPTAEERRFMDLAGAQPCMACAIDGRHNTLISLHHTDGRTKPGAHFRVIPVCAPHHQQDDSDPLQRPSIHGRKATFTARYGTESELLERLYQLLDWNPFR